MSRNAPINPYRGFSELLFTCVSGPLSEIVRTMLAGFNEPDESTTRNTRGEAVVEFFAKQIEHDVSLAYLDKGERDGTQPQHVVLWEPRIRPGVTVFMGADWDGMGHSVFALSNDSPYTWVNIRIYDDAVYPGSFFDYYANHRTIVRRVMACRDEEGWDFAQKGAVQPFENANYYIRRSKKDRLNREIITEYMETLGYMIAHDGFWRTDKPAYLLWQERPTC